MKAKMRNVTGAESNMPMYSTRENTVRENTKVKNESISILRLENTGNYFPTKTYFHVCYVYVKGRGYVCLLKY